MADRSPLTRRSFLTSSAAAGGALALAPLLSPAASAAAARKKGGISFSNDPATNFELLFSFGAIAYGTGEFGALVTAANAATARGGTPKAVFEVFHDLAVRTRSYAQEADRAGNAVTARSGYLRAAGYFDVALYFVLAAGGKQRETETYAAMQACWAKAAAMSPTPIVPVEIPYESTALPGYLLKPDATDTPRPTIILNNGSDGQNVDLYAFGGLAAIERGYNALIFEGPGQGSMLFERKVYFRPDWENVVTPVVDFLSARTDVDARRIAIVGWSFGGELVSRAAAFEHRLAGVVLDPGVVDYFASWTLPPFFLRLLRMGKRREANEGWADVLKGATPLERFELAKRSEIFPPADAFDLFETMKQYTSHDVIHQITSPTLVLSPQLEQFFPGQAKELYDLLASPKKLVRFTVAEGAQYHCEPMSPQLRNEILYDWLAGVFAGP